MPAADRTLPSVAVVGEQARRSRHSGPLEQHRAGRRGLRRCRIILYVAGGLLGPGYWLCGVVSDGHVFGKSPAEVHFTEFVLASVVVVVASWGLLLILGEAMLFALAVFKADDRERYDIYRNLMILWGYVLTLGIPRHFRRLPAQFGALSDDGRSEDARRPEGREPDGGRPGDACHHEETRDGAGRPAARSSPRDRTGSRERTAARDGAGPARPRQRRTEDGRDLGGSREEPESQERTRRPAEGPAACRDRERARDRPAEQEGARRDATSRRVETSDGAPRDRAGVRRGVAARQGGASGEAGRDGDRAEEHEDVRRDGVPRGRETRDGTGRETTGERTGRRQDGSGRAPSSPREEPRDGTARRESTRDRAGERQRTRDRATPPGREDEERREMPGPRGARRDGGRVVPGGGEGVWDEARRRESPRDGVEGRESSRPLGPIFPPRPAAEAEVAPVVGSPAGPASAAFNAGAVASSFADTLPADQTELRNALDLLLRYAARIEGDETVTPPTAAEPKLCDGKPFGIAAETSGDP